MKTVIHIGQHGTGTTSIQHYLKCNRSLMMDQGLYVPAMVAGYDSPSHFILNVWSLDPNRYSRMKDRLKEEKPKNYWDSLDEVLDQDIRNHYEKAAMSNCKEVIWTNEGLYLLNSIDEYKKLKGLFDKYSNEITVVCCFRDKVSYKESRKKQLLKEGIALSSRKDSYKYLQEDSWLLDYDRKKSLLRGVFDKAIFFDYSPDDNVKSFIESIGYRLVDNSLKYRLNNSKEIISDSDLKSYE